MQQIGEVVSSIALSVLGSVGMSPIIGAVVMSILFAASEIIGASKLNATGVGSLVKNFAQGGMAALKAKNPSL